VKEREREKTGEQGKEGKREKGNNRLERWKEREIGGRENEARERRKKEQVRMRMRQEKKEEEMGE